MSVAERKKNQVMLKAVRKILRTSGTPSEASLWNLLKARRVNGYKFRRQYGIERMIVDFYCPQLKLAIELDAGYHDDVLTDIDDVTRDKYLFDHYGITTLRFSNEDVVLRSKMIIENIIAFGKTRACSHPSGGSIAAPVSPRAGEKNWKQIRKELYDSKAN